MNQIRFFISGFCLFRDNFVNFAQILFLFPLFFVEYNDCECFFMEFFHVLRLFYFFCLHFLWDIMVEMLFLSVVIFVGFG